MSISPMTPGLLLITRIRILKKIIKKAAAPFSSAAFSILLLKDNFWSLLKNKHMPNEEVTERIREEIEKTEKQIQHYRELTKPISPENAIGRVSRMDAINNKSVNESALRQAEVKLNNLKRVMGKVNGKDFGICLRCRKPIPVGRLMIRPESLYRVNCAH